MAKVNPHYSKLQAGYLFAEIAKRTRELEAKNPGVKPIRLGIGDTTQPLTPTTIKGLLDGVNRLAKKETYTGYDDQQGHEDLRQAIANYYKRYGVEIKPDEVFVSDGAKPDTSNIQQIFSPDSVIAVQDPVYPVYVDAAVMSGKTGHAKDGRYEGIVYMDATEENEFFPDVPDQRVDIIYLCSPNNPTGVVATHEQLKKFVDYAKENKSIIVFDAAYCEFIEDDSLPRSIFEIEGADTCCIEVNSFSKFAGFTGVRLGWVIVPHKAIVEGSQPGELQDMWRRRQGTQFNGASNIVQVGGVAVLSKQGQKEFKKLVEYYMHNAHIIRQGLSDMGLTVFGGLGAPYIWAKTPHGMDSWEFFDHMLNDAHVVGTPGSAFGRNGDGFFRLSGFGDREEVELAVKNIKEKLKI